MASTNGLLEPDERQKLTELLLRLPNVADDSTTRSLLAQVLPPEQHVRLPASEIPRTYIALLVEMADNADSWPLDGPSNTLGLVRHAAREATAGTKLRSDIEAFLERVQKYNDQHPWKRFAHANGDTLPVPDCPYPGLLPCVRFFFARETDIAVLRSKLSGPSYPQLVLVEGESGVGKSSLIEGGLLHDRENANPLRYAFAHLRLGSTPARELRALLRQPDGAALDLTHSQRDVLAPYNVRSGPNLRPLLIVDQVESLYTSATEAERTEAVTILRGLREAGWTLLLVAQHGFADSLIRDKLSPPQESLRYPLQPLNDEQLRTIIRKPAQQVGVAVEDVLVERLVADAHRSDARGNAQALPLLQLCLQRLWEAMAESGELRLTFALYQNIGNTLSDVVEDYADKLLQRLTDEQSPIAERILIRLVHLDDTRDTRRTQPAAALRAPEDDPGIFDRTLAFLVDNRLLRRDGDGDGGRIDLAHDALITYWRTLRRLLNRDDRKSGSLRAPELQRRELEADVRRFQQSRDLLTTEESVQAARLWQKQYADKLGDVPRLDELLERSEHAIWQRKVFRRFIGIVLFVITPCFILMFFYLYLSPLFRH